jgi:hypothetical protein
MKRLVFVSCLLFWVGGCGDDATPYSCDERQSSVPQKYCQEYVGLSSAALIDPYKASCGGAWAMGVCPRTGALGGCRAATVMGITITNWFYADASRGINTSADVMAQCTQGSSPGTFVSP